MHFSNKGELRYGNYSITYVINFITKISEGTNLDRIKISLKNKMQSSQVNNQALQNDNEEFGQNINPETTQNKQSLDIPQEDSSAWRSVNGEYRSSPQDYPIFGPFIANTLQIQVSSRSFAALSFYNEKHNLIIACFTNYTVQFFNGNTLSNLEERTLKFPSYVVQMSFCVETDMFLFACTNGNTYIYDFLKNKLTKHLKNEEHHVPAAEFIDPENYAFLLSETKRLYIGNLHYGVDCGLRSSFGLEEKSPVSLHFLGQSKTLLVGLENGEILSVKTRGLNSAPGILILESVCGSEQRKGIPVIKSARINGKEYIITAGLDRTMRIWHFVKGKMRLLRVIKTEDIVCRIVYLEKYQMIVATFRKNYVKFWRFVSGKLELKLIMGKQQYAEIFLIKEKNTLGLLSSQSNLIKLVPLYPCKNELTKENE